MLIKLHEEALGSIKIDASSRNAEEEFGIGLLSLLLFSKPN
jgi:hypothetical protein